MIYMKYNWVVVRWLPNFNRKFIIYLLTFSILWVYNYDTKILNKEIYKMEKEITKGTIIGIIVGALITLPVMLGIFYAIDLVISKVL